MSDIDDLKNEIRGLKSGKIDLASKSNSKSKSVFACTFNCIYKLWMCLVLMLLVFILAILMGAIVWFYVSINLSDLPDLADLPDLYDVGGGDLDNLAILLSDLPNNTFAILTKHNESNGSITEQEQEILTAIFNLFDTNNDSKWNNIEFTNFINVSIEPYNKFDDIDYNDDDIVTFSELTIYLAAFYEIDMFECDVSTQMLYNIFGYNHTHNDTGPDMVYFEYLSHLWFKELDTDNLGIITKETYIGYIINEEWEHHDKNDNDYVEPNEFIQIFFTTIYYKSFIKWIQIKRANNSLIEQIRFTLNSTTPQTVSQFAPSTLPLHQYDSVINEYLDDRPSQSILYQIVDLIGPSNIFEARRRRRLTTAGINTIGNCGGALLLEPNEYDTENWVDINYGTCDVGDASLLPHWCKIWSGGACSHKQWKCNNVKEPVPENKGVPGCGDCEDACYPCIGRQRDYLTSYLEDWEEYYCKGNGCCGIDSNSCFADDLYVDVKERGQLQLLDVNVGDYVFDGSEYTKILYVKKGDKKINMIQIDLNNNNKSIILTGDHLLYDIDMNLIRADNIKLDDKLNGDFIVTNIHKNIQKTHSTPLTYSGKIEVNGVVASCYTTSNQFAKRAHDLMAPFRFISTCINQDLAANIYSFIHNDMTNMYVHFSSIYNLNHFLEVNWITDWFFSLYFASIIMVKVFLENVFL